MKKIKETPKQHYRRDAEFYKQVKFRVVEELDRFHIEVFTKPHHLDKVDWYALDRNGNIVVEVVNYFGVTGCSNKRFYSSLEDAKQFIERLRTGVIYHYID